VLHRVFDQITPLIITYNEAPNIRRTLEKLQWAKRIVVVDSGSTDQTLELLSGYPQVNVIHHAFSDAASQCNFGLTHITSAWVLSLDADYELSDELVEELGSLAPSNKTAGYRARFVYRVQGRALRGSLYPSRIVLYRKNMASYRQQGHTQRVVVNGDVLPLKGVIFHDDRKSLARWLVSQRRYARDEAEYLVGSRLGVLRGTDKVRLMAWPAPIAVFLYALFVRGCILDGWPGWYYVLQRVISEALIALEIIERQNNLSVKVSEDIK
jgi:glycosyltransferase involved in cell wall biosynthesis